MLNQIKLESKEASYCSKVIWKKRFEKKFYLSLENYNGKLRDNFFHETIEILNKNFDKLFFIASGTLLGFIRESDFIEWDDNIDLSFYLEKDSLNNLIKLQSIFLEKNYIARIYTQKNYLKLSLFKYGYKVDLCSISKIKNFYVSNLYKFPVDCLDQFKKIEFKKVEVKIPLKEMYPSFRGRRLNQPNFSNDYIEEITFLVGNKKNENFKLLLDKIEFK